MTTAQAALADALEGGQRWLPGADEAACAHRDVAWGSTAHHALAWLEAQGWRLVRDDDTDELCAECRHTGDDHPRPCAASRCGCMRWVAPRA